MKNAFYFVSLLYFSLISCFHGNNEEIGLKDDGNSLIGLRSEIELTEEIIQFGVVIPAGTTLIDNSSSIEIQLPENYTFILQLPNGNLSYQSKFCYTCTCTPTAAGCDPTYVDGVFSCAIESPCNSCTSKKVDCQTGLQVNIIAVVNRKIGIKYISSYDEFNSLSDIQTGDSLVYQAVLEYLGADTIMQTLFTNAYAQSTEPEDTLIFVSVYGNKMGISVKRDWDDYYTGAIPEIIDPTLVYCDCVSSNPFNLVSGTCDWATGYFSFTSHRCKNNCSEACRMTIVRPY